MEVGALVGGIQSNRYCGTQIAFQHSFWEGYSSRKITTYEKKGMANHTNTHP